MMCPVMKSALSDARNTILAAIEHYRKARAEMTMREMLTTVLPDGSYVALAGSWELVSSVCGVRVGRGSGE